MLKNRSFKRTVGYKLEYIGWKVATAATKLLSRSVAIVISDVMGWVSWRIFHVRRKTVLENLNIAFGGRYSAKELDRIALRSMQGMVLTFLEFIQPELTGKFGGTVIGEIENVENATPYLEKPLICVVAHIGNWEAMAHYATSHQIKFKAFVKLMHNPLVNREILKLRKKYGINIIPVSALGKIAVDTLRNGQWLAFLGDQDASKRGIFVNFFGRPASTFKGAGLYSWKLNIPILPSFMVRNHDKHRSLKLIVLPAIIPDPKADKETEVARLTQLHTKGLESVIERYPESYFWVHRRWKTQPKKTNT